MDSFSVTHTTNNEFLKQLTQLPSLPQPQSVGIGGGHLPPQERSEWTSRRETSGCDFNGSAMFSPAPGSTVGSRSPTAAVSATSVVSSNQSSNKSGHVVSIKDKTKTVFNTIKTEIGEEWEDGGIVLPLSVACPPLARHVRHIFPQGSERFSRKVFVGGLPIDISERTITDTFECFGALTIDWPRRNDSNFPPRGYVFLVFEHESSVRRLVSCCHMDGDKYYIFLSSLTMKNKPVQVRPWLVADADFVRDPALPCDPRKTVFIGGVPRPLRAVELAELLDGLLGDVIYAGIDTDPELKYPKGAARVTFRTFPSYLQALTTRFVQIQHTDAEKRVEIKPYVMEDQLCDECHSSRCGGKFACMFCASLSCLQYYCEQCWHTTHTQRGLQHKAMLKLGQQNKERRSSSTQNVNQSSANTCHLPMQQRARDQREQSVQQQQSVWSNGVQQSAGSQSQTRTGMHMNVLGSANVNGYTQHQFKAQSEVYGCGGSDMSVCGQQMQAQGQAQYAQQQQANGNLAHNQHTHQQLMHILPTMQALMNASTHQLQQVFQVLNLGAPNIKQAPPSYTSAGSAFMCNGSGGGGDHAQQQQTATSSASAVQNECVGLPNYWNLPKQVNAHNQWTNHTFGGDQQ